MTMGGAPTMAAEADPAGGGWLVEGGRGGGRGEAGHPGLWAQTWAVYATSPSPGFLIFMRQDNSKSHNTSCNSRGRFEDETTDV